MFCALAVRSALQVEYWADDITLYSHNLEINPDSAVAHVNMAQVLMSQRRVDEAIVHLRRTVQLNPNYYLARDNLATLLELRGDIDGSIEQRKAAMGVRIIAA